MSLSHTSLLKHLRLITLVFGAVLFVVMFMAAARTAHAVSYVRSGTITLCHEGTGPTNTWNTLAVNATIPSGSFAVSFQVQTATSCTVTPGAFSGHVFSVTSATAQDLSAFTTASKALFVQVTLTGDGTNTPVLNSATLVDTPGSTPDTTAPTVSLASPGSTVSGATVALSATSTDNTGGSGVAKVDFRQAAGSSCSAASTLIGSDTTANGTTYNASWDTTGLANGAYTVCAVSTDSAGNVSSASSRSVTVSNTTTDVTPPTSTLSSPGTGALSGTITLSSNATDNSGGSGIAKVDFRQSTATCTASSTLIGSATTPASGSTYSVSWNTTSVANAAYNLCSVATDRSGNVQASPSSQSVTVSNTVTAAVTVTNPTNGATVSGSGVTLSATTTGTVNNVKFKVDGTGSGLDSTGPSPWSVIWDSTKVVNGSHQLTAEARDSANTVLATSPAVTITVNNQTVDTQAPSTPAGLAASATSSTNVHLAWTASTDNVGVAGYRIFRDGSSSALTSTTSTTFDDTTVTPTTNYTYIVKAFDAAGNVSAASNTAGVTTPCSGDCVAPSAPTNLSGTASTVGSPATSVKVVLTWTAATDNVGVTGYTVLRNGTAIANNVVAATYTDTTPQPNTSYTYTVVAKDAAGNVSTSSAGFTVQTPSLPDSQAPSVPQNLSAIPASSTQVNLSWNASTDNVGVDHYNVFRNTVKIGTSIVAGFGDATVSASTTYSYTVKAVDASGNSSAASVAASVTTPSVGTGTTTPVYRLSTPIGGHFWTSDTNELNYTLTNLHYSLEGIAFKAFISGKSPVYRLATPREQLSGGHFWTDSVDELNYVVSNLGYVVEGAAFQEDVVQQTGEVPVYRMSIPAGGHFWTSDPGEVNYVATNLGYVLEGVAWYAPTN